MLWKVVDDLVCYRELVCAKNGVIWIFWVLVHCLLVMKTVRFLPGDKLILLPLEHQPAVTEHFHE